MRDESYTLVTGASKGIGQSLAHEFAQRNQPLILVARNEKLLKNVKEECETLGSPKVELITCDLANHHDMKLILKIVEEKQLKVSTLVNNAGWSTSKDFMDDSWENIESMIFVNQFAPVYLTKKILELGHLKQVINIGSMISRMPTPHYTIYTACKSFIENFSLCLGVELKKRGVQVLCVQPGMTLTDFFKNTDQEFNRFYDFVSMTPTSVAKKAIHALDQGKMRLVVGFTNQLTCAIYHFVPKSIIAKLTYFFILKAKKKPLPGNSLES